MKYRALSFLAFAGMFLNSCAVDEIPSGEGTLLAIMENDDTRTAVTDEGEFTWSLGDQIWLHTTSGSLVGTLSSGSGTSSATFSHASYIGEMTGKAICPYNAGHSISDDVLNVVMPTSYKLGSTLTNTNAAMYGVNIGGTLKFNHMAGVMRFKFKTVPAGVNKFTITLDKKINGTFSADLSADYPIIKTTDASTASEKSITLNFDALTSTSDISLYVPLPIGIYNYLELGLYDDNQLVWKYSNNVTNKVNRKSLILMPSVTLSGSIGGELEDGDSVHQNGDYVDEYGVNHGQGVKIGEIVWAPVNCGYHATDYKYGKLYQWGRKYGQGYYGGIYDIDGNTSENYADATVPQRVEGPVALEEGQSMENIGKFYYNRTQPYHWESTQNNALWNSGTEDSPVKTEYDPCPEGWRVPTSAELSELSQNMSLWTTSEEGQIGYWFSGMTSYSADVAQVFFPAAGQITFASGGATARGRDGFYWSSTARGNYACGFDFTSTNIALDTDARARGHAVRCVQDSEHEQVQEVEINCILMGNGGSKSIGYDNGNLYLSDDDFVDVNGVDYPVQGNGTNFFVVKVPKAESYIVSYPADAVKFESDGACVVYMPDKYVGSSFGVFIGSVETESMSCNLEAICSLLRVNNMSSYENWDRIEFSANCGTALWGDAVLQSDYSISKVNNGVSSVMITRNSDEQYVFIPLLPRPISGITITVYDKLGEVLIKRKSSNDFSFKRGSVTSLKI